MGSMSIMHWLIVVAVVLLLFGRGKIPELMGDVANGIKSFKKGMQDDEPDANKPSESASAEIGVDHQLSAPVTPPVPMHPASDSERGIKETAPTRG